MNARELGKVWKIAIAGLGAAARAIHLPAYRYLPQLRLVGGYDPDPAAAAVVEPRFTSLEAMLQKARPDLLAVVAPPAAHYDLVCRGLEAGCHIFCEKPLVPDFARVPEILAMAEKAGRRVFVNQQYRFMNIHRAIRRVVGGDLGRALFLDARQAFVTDKQTETGWRGRDPRRTCQEFGIHVLDLCRFFFASEPHRIFARMPRSEAGGPDFLDLIQLDFPGGETAQITLDRLCRGRHRYLELQLDGEYATVESRIGGSWTMTAGLAGGPRRRPIIDCDFSLGGRARLFRGERWKTLARDPIDLFAHATARLLEVALDALQLGRRPPCDLTDNLRSLALVTAAYESDRLGIPLDLRWDPLPYWSPTGANAT